MGEKAANRAFARAPGETPRGKPTPRLGMYPIEDMRAKSLAACERRLPSGGKGPVANAVTTATAQHVVARFP